MKIFTRISVLLLTLTLVSCSSPKMDAKEIESMALGYENGVICGVSIGDDYTDVKKNLHESWKHVADEETIDFAKFMKQWDDDNYFIFSLNMDKNRKVRGVTLVINGNGENKEVIAQFKQEVHDEFSKKYSFQKNESWDFIAANGDECSVSFDTEQYQISNEIMFSFSTTNYSPLD